MELIALLNGVASWSATNGLGSKLRVQSAEGKFETRNPSIVFEVGVEYSVELECELWRQSLVCVGAECEIWWSLAALLTITDHFVVQRC